jgi:hypothetical protein
MPPVSSKPPACGSWRRGNPRLGMDIVGEAGASFAMIRRLVDRLPTRVDEADAICLEVP